MVGVHRLIARHAFDFRQGVLRWEAADYSSGSTGIILHEKKYACVQGATCTAVSYNTYKAPEVHIIFIMQRTSRESHGSCPTAVLLTAAGGGGGRRRRPTTAAPMISTCRTRSAHLLKLQGDLGGEFTFNTRHPSQVTLRLYQVYIPGTYIVAPGIVRSPWVPTAQINTWYLVLVPFIIHATGAVPHNPSPGWVLVNSSTPKQVRAG